MNGKSLESLTLKFYKKFNVDSIIESINSFNEEWEIDTSRQNLSYENVGRKNPHRFTKTYMIQYHDLYWSLGEKFVTKIMSSNENLIKQIDPIKQYLEKQVDGTVARILIVKLGSESSIDRHVDSGDYLETSRRFHIPLITNESVIFEVDGDKKHLRSGEIWQINNMKPHSVENKRGERVHLIIDVMPKWAIDMGNSSV